MDEIDFLIRFFLALGIGGLIGLEREHSKTDRIIIAGIRTFPLVAIAGFAIAFIHFELDFSYAIYIGIGIFGATSILMFYIRHKLGMSGLTTPIALFITFLIGVLIGEDHLFEGLVIGIVTTFLLLEKHRLHHIASVLKEEEILSALEFITIAFILLPLTATMKPISIDSYPIIGRHKLIDIYWILLIVILVSSISFISFIVLRRLEHSKGLEVSGLLGGLVNSEAATGAISELAAKNEGILNLALAGILLANFTMLIRNIAIAVISDPSLEVLKYMLFPCIIIASGNILFAFSLERKKECAQRIEMETPFAIKPALMFGCLFAFISAISFVLIEGLGSRGVYAIALGGFVSSAAVTASLSTLAFTGDLNAFVAGQTITLACIISTLNKFLLMRTSSKNLAKRALVPLLESVILGVITLVIMSVLSFCH